MNPNVDTYLNLGCGRCSFYATPECKVNTWREELIQLRKIVLSCGLTEEFKWKQPCYTFNKNNVLLVTAFKEYSTISFFKGTLLKDKKRILVKPGENSQAARQFRFTDVQKVIEMEPVIKSYIKEAIEIEKAGLKIDFKAKEEIEYPEELLNKFSENKKLKTAFEELTPGRQRGYILYFTQPKQSKTRESRIDKCTPRILKGIGLHDR